MILNCEIEKLRRLSGAVLTTVSLVFKISRRIVIALLVMLKVLTITFFISTTVVIYKKREENFSGGDVFPKTTSSHATRSFFGKKNFANAIKNFENMILIDKIKLFQNFF